VRGFLPHPLASAALFALWLLLAQSLSPGHLLIAALTALGGGATLALLDAPRARIRRPAAILTLGGRLAVDMLAANLATLRSILSARPPRASFLDVPIGLRDPYALATLSIVVTCTPGTIWVEFDDTTGVLTLHVLDLDDPARMVAFIQRRYEAPIREIFE
jgi:multicomponent K+:H+ antiporter subunit E